jgi:ABC-type Mn2+/Zn2+ transport system permease subunit
MGDFDRSFRTWLSLWELFADATWAGVLSGALLGALGVFIVARRMVFFSAVLSQASGMGTILGLWLWNALLDEEVHRGHELLDNGGTVAFAFAVSAVVALTLGGRGAAAQRDQRLGAAWVVSTALVLVLGSTIPTTMIPNITLWMFSGRGEAGVITPDTLRFLIVTLVPVAIVQIVLHRGFVDISLDPVAAKVRRVPVVFLETCLLLSLAAVTSVSASILGMLPVFAFSILPAIAALRLARNLTVAMGLASVLGALAAFVGFYLAFRWSAPVGAMQSACAAAFTGALLAARPLWARLGSGA